jgi:hypothetical protein
MFDHRTRGGATVGRGYRDSNQQREFGENSHRGFESNGRGQRGGRPNTFENFKKKQSFENRNENSGENH